MSLSNACAFAGPSVALPGARRLQHLPRPSKSSYFARRSPSLPNCGSARTEIRQRGWQRQSCPGFRPHFRIGSQPPRRPPRIRVAIRLSMNSHGTKVSGRRRQQRRIGYRAMNVSNLPCNNATANSEWIHRSMAIGGVSAHFDVMRWHRQSAAFHPNAASEDRSRCPAIFPLLSP
jgi:hypothetical protein